VRAFVHPFVCSPFAKANDASGLNMTFLG